MREQLWPSVLTVGECIGKQRWLRSSNGLYGLSLDANGTLKLNFGAKSSTYEKNIESLLVTSAGVLLVYDGIFLNQFIRIQVEKSKVP